MKKTLLTTNYKALCWFFITEGRSDNQGILGNPDIDDATSWLLLSATLYFILSSLKCQENKEINRRIECAFNSKTMKQKVWDLFWFLLTAINMYFSFSIWKFYFGLMQIFAINQLTFNLKRGSIIVAITIPRPSLIPQTNSYNLQFSFDMPPSLTYCFNSLFFLQW